MTRIEGSVTVPVPARRVYDLACTPTLWPKWYPITKSVEVVKGTPGVPVTAGDVVLEHVVMLGMPLTFRWEFLEADRPRRLRYEGSDVKRGGHASITYDFTESSDAQGRVSTTFHRVLEYESQGLLMRFLNWLIISRVFRRASDEALQAVRRELSVPGPS